VEAKNFVFRKFFFVFKILKPLVLEDLCLGMGSSVACALTGETIFEIMKCMFDVDMRGRARMGSKAEIFRFFNSGYAQKYFVFLDVGHSFEQE